LNGAKKEGIEQGIKEGIEQGKSELLSKQLSKKFKILPEENKTFTTRNYRNYRCRNI